MQRESYLRWGLQYDWIADMGHVGGQTVIPRMVPSLLYFLTNKIDTHITPLFKQYRFINFFSAASGRAPAQEPDKEPEEQ